VDVPTALEDRVQRLEDLIAIQQLLVDYGRFLDAGDIDAYASLFTEDAELQLGPHGHAQGRAEIHALLKNTMGPPGSSYRIISGPQVELNGDRATSTALFAVIVPTRDGGVALTTMGHHVDELRREGSRWCFARREAIIDLPRS
jgi:uncharacterized protein (TIGR02246 family)